MQAKRLLGVVTAEYPESLWAGRKTCTKAPPEKIWTGAHAVATGGESGWDVLAELSLNTVLLTVESVRDELTVTPGRVHQEVT
jgi:hypothetical protein